MNWYNGVMAGYELEDFFFNKKRQNYQKSFKLAHA